jgi:hypothetical protein
MKKLYSWPTDGRLLFRTNVCLVHLTVVEELAIIKEKTGIYMSRIYGSSFLDFVFPSTFKGVCNSGTRSVPGLKWKG